MFKLDAARMMLMLTVGGGALAAAIIGAGAILQQPAPVQTAPQPTQSPGGNTAPAPPPSFEILDVAQQLTVSVARNDRSGFNAKATVFIRNADDSDIEIRFQILAQDESGERYPGNIEVGGGPVEMKPRTVQAFLLDIKGDKPLPPFGYDPDDVPQSLTGYLAVEATKKPKEGASGTTNSKDVKLRPLKLNPPLPSASAGHPIGWGLAASLIVIAISLLCAWKSLAERMVLPDWNPTKSWATMLTALGALLGLVLQNAVIPTQTHVLQKSEYNTLHLLFAVLAAVAPLIYNAIRFPAGSGQTAGDSQYETYIWLLLVSSAVTMWALFGQIITLYFLLDELWKIRLMSEFGVTAFKGLLIILGVALASYGVMTICSSTKKVETEESPGGRALAPRWDPL